MSSGSSTHSLLEVSLSPSPPPYHILSRKQKWNLVLFASLAGSFSPLSSNIYFPATDTISSDLGVNASLVALTITVYMIAQGIAPSLFGAVSDCAGRRLTFTLCLSIYTAANLALAFTANYPMLMALRALQAAGSAATISISAGVIADIACAGERGGFMGANAGIRMTGQALGPILGGALNSAWGFRSIFWFLFALSVLVLLVLLVCLPETQRRIAGNGSIPLSGFHKPLTYILHPPTAWSTPSDCPHPQPTTTTTPRPPFSWKDPFRPLTYLFEKDIAAVLAWGAVAYTAWSMVTSSTTPLLRHGFPSLTPWQIGLCFLPNGLGCVASSFITGALLDRSFRRVEARYKRTHGIPPADPVTASRDFPYIRARLHLMPLFSLVLVVCLALYGPSFEFNDVWRHQTANLAAPLVLQFGIAASATAIFNVNSTVLIDCFPERPASATALNNLCRCLVGAAGVGVVQPLVAAVRPMRAFGIVAAVVGGLMPLVWMEWKWGEEWRREREGRMEQRNRSQVG